MTEAVLGPIDAALAIPVSPDIYPQRNYQGERLLTLEDIGKIDDDLLPMLVFADSIRGMMSLLVKQRTHGNYGHFMWLLPDELGDVPLFPNIFASQWWYFKKFAIEAFSGSIMKFVYNPYWSSKQKLILINTIRADLAKSRWETRYDVWAIVGHLFGLRWLQSARFEICSETADYLKLVDGKYDLKNPTPSDVNSWWKKYSPAYEVYGRYMAGD